MATRDNGEHGGLPGFALFNLEVEEQSAVAALAGARGEFQ
jgi:hypothetical protein